MLGPVSIGTQQDIDTALRLAKLVSDPDTAAARLAELKAAAEQANALIETANARDKESSQREAKIGQLIDSANALDVESKKKSEQAEREGRRLMQRIEQDRNALKAERERFEYASAATQRRLSDLEASIQPSLDSLKKQQADAKRAFEERDAALVKAESGLAAREKELADAIAKATATRNEYESKIDALRKTIA